MVRWAAAVGAVAALAGHTPSLFTLSDPSGRLDAPASIAAGRGNTMWIADSAPLSEAGGPRFAVGRVDLAGRYRRFHTTAPTFGIAVVRDGTAFATEPDASRIARIEPDGHVTEIATLTPHAQPRAITAGPDGNAWFTESTRDGVSNVGRITVTGEIREFPVPPLPFMGDSVPADPGGIVAGPGGRLYFTTALGVGSITTAGAVAGVELPQPASPLGIAAGPDGALWVTEDSIARIDRVTVAGDTSAVPLPLGASGGSIAAGPNGVLYALQSGAPRLWRVTNGLAPLDLRLVERTALGGGRGPTTLVSENGGAPGLAAGPAGTLWIAASLDIDGGTTGGVAVVNLGGRCIVPDLRSDFLAQARLDLANHDCRLGRVRKSSRLPLRDLGVVCQRPRPGTVARRGTRVAATFDVQRRRCR